MQNCYYKSECIYGSVKIHLFYKYINHTILEEHYLLSIIFDRLNNRNLLVHDRIFFALQYRHIVDGFSKSGWIGICCKMSVLFLLVF